MGTPCPAVGSHGAKHTPRATAPASTPSPRSQAQPQGSSANSPEAPQQDQMREDTSRQDTRCPTILTNRLSSRETGTRTLRGSTRRLPPASQSPAGGEVRTSRREQRYLGRRQVQGPHHDLSAPARVSNVPRDWIFSYRRPQTPVNPEVAASNSREPERGSPFTESCGGRACSNTHSGA